MSSPVSASANKTIRKSRKPAWDDTVHDLNKLRLTPQEQRQKKDNRRRYEAPWSDDVGAGAKSESSTMLAGWDVSGKLQELLEKHHILTTNSNNENANNMNVVDLDSELNRFQQTPGAMRPQQRVPLQTITPSPLAHKQQEQQPRPQQHQDIEDLKALKALVQKYQLLVKPDRIPSEDFPQSLSGMLRLLVRTLIDAEIRRSLESEDQKAKTVQSEQQLYRLQRKLAEQKKIIDGVLSENHEKEEKIKSLQTAMECQREYMEDLETRLQLIYREKSHRHLIKTMQYALAGRALGDSSGIEPDVRITAQSLPHDDDDDDDALSPVSTINARAAEKKTANTIKKKRSVQFKEPENSSDNGLLWIPLEGAEDAAINSPNEKSQASVVDNEYDSFDPELSNVTCSSIEI